jgi:hypothetical protein
LNVNQSFWTKSEEILEADLVNGENLKKAVEEHSKACDEVKIELEKHKGA